MRLAAWLAATGVAVAAQAAPRPPADAPPAPDAPVFTSRQLLGEITQWNPDEQRLVIETNGKRTALELQEGSTVFIEGRLGTAAELEEGQFVRTAWEERDGKAMVRWIEVTEPANAPTPSKAAPEAPRMGSYEGTITGVDTRSGSFVLDTGTRRWTFRPGKAQLTVGGKKAGVEALPRNTRVRASWEAGKPRRLNVQPLER